MIKSPIAKLVPAVIPRKIGLSPEVANVMSVAIKEIDPHPENPPKKDTINKMRYAFCTPNLSTNSSGLQKNKMMNKSARKTIINPARRMFFARPFCFVDSIHLTD